MESAARADPTLTATSTVRADGGVSFLANWSCTAPWRTCSYGWYREDGAKLAGGTAYRSYVAQAGVFAAGCHTVESRITYWFGRETAARRQTATTSFCVPVTA